MARNLLRALLVVLLVFAFFKREWIAGLSDATWWRVTPWVILALFWIGVGIREWRRRAGRAAV